MKDLFLSYFIMTTIILIVTSIIVYVIAKKSSKKQLLSMAGFIRGACIVLIIYFGVFSYSCYSKLNPLINAEIEVYKFPDDLKVNNVVNMDTKKYEKQSSELTDSNYFDKVVLTYTYDGLSYGRYLIGILSYPFNFSTTFYFNVQAEEQNATRLAAISGIATLEDNVVTVGDYQFKYTEEVSSIMFGHNVYLQVCYEEPDDGTEIIKKYVFLEGEITND